MSKVLCLLNDAGKILIMSDFWVWKFPPKPLHLRCRYILQMIGGCFNGQPNLAVKLVKVCGDLLSFFDEYNWEIRENSKHGMAIQWLGKKNGDDKCYPKIILGMACPVWVSQPGFFYKLVWTISASSLVRWSPHISAYLMSWIRVLVGLSLMNLGRQINIRLFLSGAKSNVLSRHSLGILELLRDQMIHSRVFIQVIDQLLLPGA